MMDRIPPHTHCRECGRPVELGKRFCSEGCEQKHIAMIKKRRNQLYLFYALVLALLVIFLFSRG